MKRALIAFPIGLLFGLGLTVSQMINPAKVLAFLDLFGAWDPSLIVVMGGALAVTGFGYRLVWQRPAPLLASAFQQPTGNELDARLLVGAALFGVGWGLAGYCPGPALAALGLAAPKTLLFVAAMLAGMGLHDFWVARMLAKPSAAPLKT